RRRIEGLIQELRDSLERGDERGIDIAQAELQDEVYELNREAYLYDEEGDDEDLLSQIGGTLRRTFSGEGDRELDDYDYGGSGSWNRDTRWEDDDWGWENSYERTPARDPYRQGSDRYDQRPPVPRDRYDQPPLPPRDPYDRDPYSRDSYPPRDYSDPYDRDPAYGRADQPDPYPPESRQPRRDSYPPRRRPEPPESAYSSPRRSEPDAAYPPRRDRRQDYPPQRPAADSNAYGDGYKTEDWGDDDEWF
ncbi:MAG: hypothetical protein F6K04_22695, partial [Leptolyngbya sp. SIO4C5]|nr:hypothetical protein [Leptolyngbya sp. SIO4C5]